MHKLRYSPGRYLLMEVCLLLREEYTNNSFDGYYSSEELWWNWVIYGVVQNSPLRSLFKLNNGTKGQIHDDAI